MTRDKAGLAPLARGSVHALASFAVGLLLFAAAPGAAAADCVAPLAHCAMRCDQRIRPESPDRPLCAQSCISGYQRCARIAQIQSNTGGAAQNQRGQNAPAQ